MNHRIVLIVECNMGAHTTLRVTSDVRRAFKSFLPRGSNTRYDPMGHPDKDSPTGSSVGVASTPATKDTGVRLCHAMLKYGVVRFSDRHTTHAGPAMNDSNVDKFCLQLRAFGAVMPSHGRAPKKAGFITWSGKKHGHDDMCMAWLLMLHNAFAFFNTPAYKKLWKTSERPTISSYVWRAVEKQTEMMRVNMNRLFH